LSVGVAAVVSLPFLLFHSPSRLSCFPPPFAMFSSPPAVPISPFLPFSFSSQHSFPTSFPSQPWGPIYLNPLGNVGKRRILSVKLNTPGHDCEQTVIKETDFSEHVCKQQCNSCMNTAKTRRKVNPIFG